MEGVLFKIEGKFTVFYGCIVFYCLTADYHNLVTLNNIMVHTGQKSVMSSLLQASPVKMSAGTVISSDPQCLLQVHWFFTELSPCAYRTEGPTFWWSTPLFSTLGVQYYYLFCGLQTVGHFSPSKLAAECLSFQTSQIFLRGSLK